MDTTTNAPQVWVTVETADNGSPAATGKRLGDVDTGGGFGGGSLAQSAAAKLGLQRKRITLDARLLRDQMSGLLSVVGDLFDQAAQQPHMKLEELELSVEIDGEGQVNLVGNGARLGNSGGITLKFTAR